MDHNKQRPVLEGPLRSVPIESMASAAGSDFGVSAWQQVDQKMIDAFADLTNDRNFVHVDPRRAAATPFGGTIAHGFLTLSLVAGMAYEVCPGVDGSHTTVNYGFNRLRFVAAVPCNARVRGRFKLAAFTQPSPDRWQATYEVTVELEASTVPALVAEWITVGFLSAATG